MDKLDVRLSNGDVDSYEYGIHPMADRGDGEGTWTVCHAVTPEGVLIVGTARTYFTATGITQEYRYFEAKVTYAPGSWVKVIGGSPIRDD